MNEWSILILMTGLCLIAWIVRITIKDIIRARVEAVGAELARMDQRLQVLEQSARLSGVLD